MTGLNRDDALKRADAAQPGLLDCLQTLIRQPSVSATGEGIDECAALVGEVMEEAGIHTEVLRLDGAPPLVCGEVRSGINPDRTLLFYNHYDVQSPEPLDLWQDPPFSGRVIGDKIFGRGASDDKGELVTRIKAVESYLQACGDVPCNIKFVVEGEEETGSASIMRYLDRYRSRLACDGVIWEFGFVDARDRPIISLGMKGLLYVELSKTESIRDAHSSLAVLIRNPAWRLVQALNSMRDPDGKILIADWHKEARPLSETDLRLLEREPFDGDSFKEEFGVDGFLAGRQGLDAKVALACGTTCNIAGFHSGYAGPGAKTVLPAGATAKLDFRLVPDMDPKTQLARLREHLRSGGFGDIRVRVLSAETASRTDPSHEFVGQVESAARESFGDAVLSISNPGTGPMHQFASALGAPCVSVGCTHIFSRIHSPNEFARLSLLQKATRCICLVMDRFGKPRTGTPVAPGQA